MFAKLYLFFNFFFFHHFIFDDRLRGYAKLQAFSFNILMTTNFDISCFAIIFETIFLSKYRSSVAFASVVFIIKYKRAKLFPLKYLYDFLFVFFSGKFLNIVHAQI